MRHIVAPALGAVVSFSLFVFMTQLVRPSAPPVSTSLALADLTSIRVAPEPESVKPERPKIAAMPTVAIPAGIPQTTGDPHSEIVRIPLGEPDGVVGAEPVPGLPDWVGEPAGDEGKAGVWQGALVPLVQRAPVYPPDAARQQLEGWVELGFSVTAQGTVTDVRVLAAQPRRIFDAAAKAALLSWRYRPLLVDGHAVGQTGHRVRIDFHLEP